MFLNKVLKEIEEKKVASISQLAKDLNLTQEEVEFAVDFWKKKGKISQREFCGACNQDCSSCKIKF